MYSALPKPGEPWVEFIYENLARWTFASTDRATQDAEFRYWRGYFGFEEDDEPDEVRGNVWLVRKTLQEHGN